MKYEVIKIGRTWYVMADGKVDSGYTTKKYATKVMEKRIREEQGEQFNPRHPEWLKMLAH